MPDQDTDQEPSIEEILTSIRQIISDEDEEADAVDDAPEPEPEPIPEPEPEVDEDVVELTDKIEDEEPEPAPEPEHEKIDVDMQDAIEAYEAPKPKPKPEPVMPEDDTDTLLTDAAEDAAYDAFSELARKTAVESGGITLEEIVRKELRPHLKGWLDRHLPIIIERLVQEELDRVAKRAMEE